MPPGSAPGPQCPIPRDRRWPPSRYARFYEPASADPGCESGHALGPAIKPGTDHAVTFAGQSVVTIAKGADVLSDPVEFPVKPLEELAVTLYLPPNAVPSTVHGDGMQTSYITLGGDATAATSLPTGEVSSSRYYVTDLEVEADNAAGAIATLGDSITDGSHSTQDRFARWPDALVVRLQADPALASIAVLNAGISGSRLLNDGVGPSALSRFNRDILDKPGVRWVVLLDGINDIGTANAPPTPQDDVSAAQIIDGMKLLTKRAHEKGIKIWGATLLPFAGTEWPFHTAAGEQKRQVINAWIRTGGAFDAVLDFDRVVRDPQHLEKIAANFDSGDHLHPNDAGYRALAASIDLRSLTRTSAHVAPAYTSLDQVQQHAARLLDLHHVGRVLEPNQLFHRSMHLHEPCCRDLRGYRFGVTTSCNCRMMSRAFSFSRLEALLSGPSVRNPKVHMYRAINPFNAAVTLLWLGGSLASAPLHAQTGLEADRVLRQAAAAAGESRWSSVRFIRVKGELETSGLTGTFESTFDARTGYYRNSQQLGPASGADGFDGKAVWQQDDAGQTTLQGSEDSVRGAANTAYQNARGYWHRDKFPADIVYVRREVEGADVFDVLRVTPNSGRPMEEWFDARSHLLARTVEQAATRTTTTYFSDYHRVLGALVAYAIRQTTGEAKYDAFLKIASVSPKVNPAATAFDPPPASSKADFGISSEDGTTTVPFKLINNHMYVDIDLNGKSYDFLFDTGGRNVLTPTTARALGLTTQGALQGGGVGEKSEDVGVTKVAHMAIGGAHLDDQTFVVIALESLGAVEGRPITGIFGYEVFKRFIVRTDYEKLEITLSDPASFKYSGTGTRVPFTFSDTNPLVNGEIGGLKGTFTLDTGSRASLDLSSPFVVRNDLVKRWSANFHGVSGWGAGGAARSSFARPALFILGGIPIPNPVVGLSGQRKGAESDIYVAGNVGAGILKRFNVIWDYPHLQIFFEPNNHYGEPDVFDRAGLWVNVGDHGFIVIDVIGGGPAESAGLQAGDNIVSVDGRVAGREISLPDFRQYAKGAPGTSLTLNVQRGDENLKITLILRDLV